jgi:branched-chain amino acid transport system ATP-binding protein
LAPQIRQVIWECVATLRSLKQAILIIDRDMEHLGRLADRQYILEKGKVAWFGSAADFRAQSQELERFLKVSSAAGGSA